MLKDTTTEKTIIRTERGLTIAGTRITLYTIMDYLNDEWPAHLIRDWFDLTEQQIEGAIDYIETHREEVEGEYRDVLAGAEEIREYWEEKNKERLADIVNLPPPPDKEAAWAKLQERKKRLVSV
jgi:uncharacterized protein (DUF433 family)